MDLTPAMKQYMDIKRQHKDAILFFRMGDFYEMFFEDAIIASRILDIALTTRDKESGIPMCGVPYHARDTYIVKLLRAGQNVAVCEQFEQQGKGGIFRREVVEVLTPGLIPRDDLLESEKGNFLVSISLSEAPSISAVDISTGELFFERHEGWEKVIDSLNKIDVAEIIYDEDTAERIKFSDIDRRLPSDVPRREVIPKYIQETRKIYEERFSDFVPEDRGFFILLDYVYRNQPGAINSLKNPQPFQVRKTVSLDESALTSLEILSSAQGTKKGSLLWVLDRTKTPMGKRLVKRWLAFPLCEIEEIVKRHEAVEELYLERDLRITLSEMLEEVFDMERLAVRLSSKQVNPKDLISISSSLKVVERISDSISQLGTRWIAERLEKLVVRKELVETIEDAISDNPPVNVREGGIFKDGYNPQVDALRELEVGGDRYLKELEERERARTGIPNLRVKYNRVFGYFIEITRTHAEKVPPDYVRKQTLVNSERFITPELKEFENRQLSAREERRRLEETLFRKLVEELSGYAGYLSSVARAVGEIDVMLSFASVAERNGYVRPKMTRDRGISIKGGRHPVVEVFTGRREFVPNDTELDPDEEQIMVITGPNMSGKSTYIRQVALITLMAQAGSFVPAEDATIGVVDSIFTRIGAADSIFMGDSTFMVEMKEVARILREVTDRSLIILDEVGRGTSTYDGLSIAWAVIEYIHNLGDKKPLTLFATHYHEICELEKYLERVVNYNVAVKEWGDQILFLHKIEKGPSNRSYGIYVGKIAGLPEGVIRRAREILKTLETEKYNERRKAGSIAGRGVQLSLFGEDRKYEAIGRLLESVDVNRITPIDALNLLTELKEKWEGGKR